MRLGLHGTLGAVCVAVGCGGTAAGSGDPSAAKEPELAALASDGGDASAPCVEPHDGVVVLACGRDGPLDLVVAGDLVVFTENNVGAVYAVPKDGGPVRTLQAPTGVGNGSWGLATDGRHVFFTDRAGGNVDVIDLGKGTVETMVAHGTAAQPYGIATDGVQVYWAEYGANLIWAAPIGGPYPATASLYASTSLGATGIDVSGGQLVYSVYQGFVFSVSSPGVTTPLTAAHNDDSRFVATDGVSVYWTQSDGHTVSVVPIDKSSPPAKISTTESEPWGIRVDGSGVYWVNASPRGEHPGSVRHATPTSLGGWSVETLVDGLDDPTGIALDADAVYWTTFNGGKIMKKKKVAPSDAGADGI